jgi:APA family basic amino acid/polyamine antiporter
MSIWRTKSIEDSLADSGIEGRSLKRTLGTWDLMIMGVAVAVGAGIFSVGAKAAGNYAGPSVSLAFILAAVTCALAIMCYAEFASTVPVAGSAYTFTYATLGELLAWIIGWDLILEMLTAAAVIAKYWGIYLSNVFLLWGWDVPSELDVFGLKVSWGAFVIVAIFTTLLVLGTKLSSRVHDHQGRDRHLRHRGRSVLREGGELHALHPCRGPDEGRGVRHLVAVAVLVHDGCCTRAVRGLRPPRRSVARVLRLHRVRRRRDERGRGQEPAAQPAPRHLRRPRDRDRALRRGEPRLATAFIAVGADWAAQVISIGILAGLTTVIMVLLLGLARVVFAMSRDGLLPRSLSVTSEKRKTPVRVQLIVGALVALIAGLTDVGVLEEMINIGTLSAFVLVSIAVIVLRKKYPKLPRAFRVPWSPFLPILSAVLCVWLMLNLTTLTWVRFLVWLALGFIIYFAYSRRHSIVGKKARGELVE